MTMHSMVLVDAGIDELLGIRQGRTWLWCSKLYTLRDCMLSTHDDPEGQRAMIQQQLQAAGHVTHHEGPVFHPAQLPELLMLDVRSNLTVALKVSIL